MGEKMPPIKLYVKAEEEITVSILTNAIYYFLQYVMIVLSGDDYRLIVVHNGKLLADETYKSAKGARIAFLKLYWHHAWQDNIKPQWTSFYSPEKDWLKANFQLTGQKIFTPPQITEEHRYISKVG